MRTGKYLQLWLLMCVGLPVAVGQDRSPIDSKRIEALIRQLESDEFEERDQASAAILELGQGARQWVEKGALSSRLEVRRRCEQLLRKIDLAELERQSQSYRATGEMGTAIHLPCVREFRAIFGGDAPARAFYFDALQSDRTLLQTLETVFRTAREMGADISPPERQAILTLKSRRLFDQLSDLLESEFTPTTVDMPSGDRIVRWPGFRAETLAICALIGARDEFAEAPFLQDLVFDFFRDANLHAARKSKHLPTLRVGTAKWLTKFASRAQSLSIAMRLGMSDMALQLGRKAINGYSSDHFGDFDQDGRDDLSQAALGIVACGKFGDETDIQRLERFLDEPLHIRTWITESQDAYTCELRDLALVYSAHLAKIDPQTLGFPHLEPSAETVFVPYSISFADEAQRKQAHANWRRLPVEVRKQSPAGPSKSA